MPHDVVTFGEAMIRLSPPGFRRLEQARSLDVQVGGAELNTAVALARLGRPAAWVSRLTDNPLGRLVANHAREAGVGTEHVLWTSDDRVGLYFLEFGAQTAQRFGLKVVAVTLRENPLVWHNAWTAIAYKDGQVLRTRKYEVEIVDRLGAGDTFSAGLIHGLLDGDLQKGLDYGVAASAIKHSIPGDFAWITPEEVEALLKGPGLRISR